MSDTITIGGGIADTITLNDVYANVTIANGGSATNTGAVTGSITYPSSGTAGGYFTVGSGTSTSYPWAWANGTSSITAATNTPTLTVKGEANFEEDIKIKGRSLLETLDKIEERLKIFHPDVEYDTELEAKWQQLKELGDQYREMLKDIREKEEIWELLNR